MDNTKYIKGVEEFLKTYNAKGMAKAFAKGNMNWHLKEWKEFIAQIRRQRDQEIMERIERLPTHFVGEGKERMFYPSQIISLLKSNE